jgi:hypothetical protein
MQEGSCISSGISFVFLSFSINHTRTFLLLNVLLELLRKEKELSSGSNLQNSVQIVRSWLHVVYWLCRRIELHKSNISKMTPVCQLIYQMIQCNIYYSLLESRMPRKFIKFGCKHRMNIVTS